MPQSSDVAGSNLATFTKADVTAATAWTQVNSPVTIFTVTGTVKMRLFGKVTTALTSTAGLGTLALGTPDNIAAVIAATAVNGTKLHTVNFIWADDTASSKSAVLPNTGNWFVVSDTTVVVTIATADMTAGGINIYSEWQAVTPGASVA